MQNTITQLLSILQVSSCHILPFPITKYSKTELKTIQIPTKQQSEIIVAHSRNSEHTKLISDSLRTHPHSQRSDGSAEGKHVRQTYKSNQRHPAAESVCF